MDWFDRARSGGAEVFESACGVCGLSGCAGHSSAGSASESRESVLAGVRALWEDLEMLADMTDEKVNAELRKLGVSDEEIAQIDEWAAALSSKLSAVWRDSE